MKPAVVKDTKFLDVLKWVVVALIALAIVGGNAYFSTVAVSIRATLMIIATLVALFIAINTAKGRIAWQFLREARIELRKVVWPTRQETVQTTLMIAGIVLIVALVLWGVDSFFAYLVSSLLI